MEEITGGGRSTSNSEKVEAAQLVKKALIFFFFFELKCFGVWEELLVAKLSGWLVADNLYLGKTSPPLTKINYRKERNIITDESLENFEKIPKLGHQFLLYAIQRIDVFCFRVNDIKVPDCL